MPTAAEPFIPELHQIVRHKGSHQLGEVVTLLAHEDGTPGEARVRLSGGDRGIFIPFTDLEPAYPSKDPRADHTHDGDFMAEDDASSDPYADEMPLPDEGYGVTDASGDYPVMKEDIIGRLLAAPLLHHDRVILRMLESLLESDRGFDFDYAGAHFEVKPSRNG